MLAAASRRTRALASSLDYEETLQRVAWLAVPALADCCVVDLLDEQCPRWELALHRAKPWRARACDGAIYRVRHVRDPRSDAKSSF